MNRLAGEPSPYLRQHADNPVDWWPWSDEAFAEARRRDVPLLLSIGYSACHWCHVMAHESFEDAATAAVMNELFVNVKVDREERPDVDAVYMEAVQTLTGHGGWPMTVFLDHDGRPFYGGTYFPPQPRHGMPGFVELLQAVTDAWRTKRAELFDQAEELTAGIRRTASLAAADRGALPTDLLDRASDGLVAAFDGQWGGLGRAPKFPQSMSLDFLLRRGISDPVLFSLDAMASGGIYDHLGGGFARYSVDDRWLVPHFEKMLYDQALLARVYLHAWQATGSQVYLQVLDETIAYVRRDLAAHGGGFCSAEDADSEGVEGRFYVWSVDEVRDVCGPDADAAIEWWGVTAGGNFEGSSILHRPVRGDLLRPTEVERARAALFERRTTRVRPGLDDKVLTEWNALFLSTLAEAAAATGRADWLDAARSCGEFLVSSLRGRDGRWLRAWQADAGARHLAFASDHAALVDAFTRLGEATGEARWFIEAASVADALLDLFRDPDGGGFFTTGHDGERLVARQKDVLDNATPSANAMAAVALVRLAALTGDDRYRAAGEEVVDTLGPLAGTHPSAFAHLLAAVELVQAGVTEVVVAGERPDLVRVVQERWLPSTVLAWGERFDSPLWEGRRDGLAYVCRDFTCRQPVDSVDALAAELPAVAVHDIVERTAAPGG